MNFFILFHYLLSILKNNFHYFLYLQINPHAADGSAKALGFMRLMRKSLFIKNDAMTTDVLLYLKKQSLFFQKPDINVADAQDVLLTTIDNLLKLKIQLVYLRFHNFTEKL